MQTFLTSSNGLTHEGFQESAENLDLQRLNSQVKENYQLFCANVSYETQKKRNLQFTEKATVISSRISSLIRTIYTLTKPTLILNSETQDKLLEQKGWQQHPATKMWRLNPAEHLSYSFHCAKRLYEKGYKQQSFVSHFLLYHFANISYKDAKCETRMRELEKVLEKTVGWEDNGYEMLPEILSIMENYPVDHNNIHWSELYARVMDSHRGNLYLKNPLVYGGWYEYKHIPYQYPGNYSDTGYYWPV